ncbi:MAG: TonB-dependent receptor [Pseudomonadota bacterium]|nr:TonB-dependent receptor [Pseudomonadota bacterium]MEC7096373.1 TonB-dependent receptor [Pseudomonadota bacterium]MEC7611382.1 TonB-dependent receptor [Pseudomonadota bacterium]MEC8000647.1 TonB-dependent receptor [Pseudomonadota bacterium]MEC8003424.1 TonB-dependent receptor [Pseudomonadota bacterium]
MFFTNKFGKRPLSLAVAAAIAPALASTALAQNPQLEEVVVTATKRAENLQDVPISVNALSGDAMRSQNIMTFDDYVEFLPNVVSAGIGPGQKEIYIRGSASEQSSITVAPAQGSAPGVALYLDEMPVSFGARNLDVYAADLERIEVLSGPQGTLFGASSQSGNMRLITNKPNQDEFEASIDFGMSSTSGGAGSNNVEAMINIPLSDRAAVRFVGYSDNQGGWIDNASGTFTPSGEVIDRNNSAGYGPFFGDFPLTTIQSASNADLAEDDWNEAKYNGFRVAASYDFNDEWSGLLTHMSQEIDVEGSFLVDPSLGDEKSQKFVPEHNLDEFDITTWTLEGRLANLDVVYTGGYIDREVDALIDYTHYNNGGGYITYYLCSGNIYSGDKANAPNTCFDPTKQYADASTNERTTHEIRLSSDPDNRLRWMAGVYMSDVDTTHIGEFQYMSTNDAFSEHIINYFGSGAPFEVGNTTIPNTAGTNTVGPRSPLTTFYNDYTRTEEETAFFGEVAFDLTDDLTVSLSARRYDLKSQLQGASNFSFGCRYGAPFTDRETPAGAGFGNAEVTPDGRCNSNAFSNDVTSRLLTLGAYAASGDNNIILNATSPNGARDMFRGGGSNAATLAAIQNGNLDISDISADGSTEEEDTIVRLSLNYNLSDDVMVYGIYSEGYRPATQNRNAGQLAANQSGVYEGYVVPAVAVTDTLENIEFGMKGEFLDRTLRLNASFYMTEITDLQVSRFDPSNVAFLVFMENVGDAESNGIDVDFQWAAGNNLLISGAASFLDTEITRLNPQLQGVAVPVGSELPLAPRFSGNIRVRYDYEVPSMAANGYVTAALVHRGESVAGIVGSAAFMDDTGVLAYGASSGLGLQNEGGTFGTVNDRTGNLPANTRFVNESATMINLSAGLEKDNWLAEVYVRNLTSEEGAIVQTAGKFTPEATVNRPRTLGLRLSYRF